MAMPLTVKQYLIKEHLSKVLNAMTLEKLLETIGQPVPDVDSAEEASWEDAVKRVKAKLTS